MSDSNKQEYTDEEINANGCNEDMSHLMEYNISIPHHMPSFRDLMVYMVITWGVIIVGMMGLSQYVAS